jgi:hypothetical protein
MSLGAAAPCRSGSRGLSGSSSCSKWRSSVQTVAMTSAWDPRPLGNSSGLAAASRTRHAPRGSAVVLDQVRSSPADWLAAPLKAAGQAAWLSRRTPANRPTRPSSPSGRCSKRDAFVRGSTSDASERLPRTSPAIRWSHKRTSSATAKSLFWCLGETGGREVLRRSGWALSVAGHRSSKVAFDVDVGVVSDVEDDLDDGAVG